MQILAGNNIFRDFLAISSWQAAVAILLFLSVQAGFWIFLKKIKIQFMYRIIMGMVIGLIFGLIIQAIIGFPEQSEMFEKITQWQWVHTEGPNGVWKEVVIGSKFKEKYTWIYELSIWSSFFKNIFINGVYLLTIPIVFIAIFKIVSKPSETGLGRITLKGLAILLFNVALMFTITFFLGVLFNVGSGVDLSTQGGVPSGKENVPLPEIIWEYIPNNIIGALAKNSIIPVMVVGALMGISVKILSRKKQVEMEAVRKAMNTGWDITMSMLMTFMKIMPLAVMSMMTYSLVARPIGMLATIGKVIGVGYLAILISIAWLTLLIFLSGIKVKGWWKLAWKPFINGFATQSSNATLPISMETLKEEMKVKDKVTGTLAPISITMGLIACAGIQAGLATSMFWTANGSEQIIGMGLFPFYMVALLVTVIASLGIAGVPGTATVVTVGVMGGIGFGQYTQNILDVIAPLDGLFDMGRTGSNILGGITAATIVAKSEGAIEDGSPILSDGALVKQREIEAKLEEKERIKQEKKAASMAKAKEKEAKKIEQKSQK